MTDAVYVRFNNQELDFINKISKDEKITRSDAIKKLVDYAAEKLRIEMAIESYKKGTCTIREGAERAGLRYFAFFDLLAKENIIGTNPENTAFLLKQMEAFM